MELEPKSKHPLARAIVEEAGNRNLTPPTAKEFESITVGGVMGRFQETEVLIGNAALLQQRFIDTNLLAEQAAKLQNEGHYRNRS